MFHSLRNVLIGVSVSSFLCLGGVGHAHNPEVCETKPPDDGSVKSVVRFFVERRSAGPVCTRELALLEAARKDSAPYVAEVVRRFPEARDLGATSWPNPFMGARAVTFLGLLRTPEAVKVLRSWYESLVAPCLAPGRKDPKRRVCSENIFYAAGILRALWDLPEPRVVETALRSLGAMDFEMEARATLEYLGRCCWGDADVRARLTAFAEDGPLTLGKQYAKAVVKHMERRVETKEPVPPPYILDPHYGEAPPKVKEGGDGAPPTPPADSKSPVPGP